MAPKKRRNLKANKPRKRQHVDAELPSEPAHVSQDDAIQAESSPFFLVLPREIRDQIYHEIWKQKVPFLIDFPRDQYQFKVRYDDAEEPTDYSARPFGAERFWEDNEDDDVEIIHQPLWILANNQMLEEAMAQFHRKLTWTFVGEFKYEPYVSPKIRVKEPLPCFIAPQMARLSYSFLLRPWDAHTLILTNMRIHMSTQLLGMAKGAENLWAIEEGVLKWLRSWKTSSSLTRRLVVEMRCETLSVMTDAPATIQVTPLSKLYLHYTNYIEFVVTISNRKDKMTFLESKLKPKLSEAGLAMMGGRGEASFEVWEQSPLETRRYELPITRWTLRFHRSLPS